MPLPTHAPESTYRLNAVAPVEYVPLSPVTRKMTALVGVPSWFAPPADGMETVVAPAPAVVERVGPERRYSVGVAPPAAEVVALTALDWPDTLPAASVARTVKL